MVRSRGRSGGSSPVQAGGERLLLRLSRVLSLTLEPSSLSILRSRGSSGTAGGGDGASQIVGPTSEVS